MCCLYQYVLAHDTTFIAIAKTHPQKSPVDDSNQQPGIVSMRVVLYDDLLRFSLGCAIWLYSVSISTIVCHGVFGRRFWRFVTLGFEGRIWYVEDFDVGSVTSRILTSRIRRAHLMYRRFWRRENLINDTIHIVKHTQTQRSYSKQHPHRLDCSLGPQLGHLQDLSS